MASALKDRVLVSWHGSLTSHLALSPHVPPSTDLPDTRSPFLCLLASQNHVSHRSVPASKYLYQIQGVGCPQQKRAGGRRTGPVNPRPPPPPTNTPICRQLTSLIPLMPPQATRMAGGTVFPVPARPRSGAPPGPCFRPHVSGFSFLPVSTAPPSTPPHPYAPFNRHPLLLPSSFLPLCLGEGVLSLCGPPSLLPFLNTVPLEVCDQVLPTHQQGSGEEKNAGLLKGTTTPKVHAK